MILIVGQLPSPFSPTTPEKPEEDPSPVKGWWIATYFGVSPTQYSKVGKGIIKAESLGSRSALFRETGAKEKSLPVLSWRWKISNVVCSAVETRKDRYDTAARVIVVFGEGGSYGLFKKGDPTGLKIEYIWANRLPQGHLFNHPGDKNCKVFVLESGERKAGQWVYEERNIRKDFKLAFGTEPPGISAIGIQTDTDQSNEMVTAYYSEPIFKK